MKLMSRIGFLVVGVLLSGVVSFAAAPAGAVVDEGQQFTSVSNGGLPICAVDGQGAVYCKNRNVNDVPVRVQGLPPVSDIDGGNQQTCALGNDKSLYCWNPLAGNYSATLIGGLPSLRDFSVGSGYVCAVTAATFEVYCWGRNYGGAADPFAPEFYVTQPRRVSGVPPSLKVAAGYAHTCVVTRSEEAYCWGDNEYGQLGDISIDRFSTPIQVSLLGPIVEISVGGQHTCAIRSDEVYCWGNNDSGQLGNGQFGGYSEVPVVIPMTANVQKVDLGDRHTCVLSVRQLWCWGSNTEGQLGDGTYAPKAQPIRVPLGPVDDFALSRYWWPDYDYPVDTTCAVEAGVVYCWGVNYRNNTTVPGNNPSPAIEFGSVPVLNTVILGDSFTAGEGTYLYNLDQACHRSTLGWPGFLDSFSRSIAVVGNFSCSGARIPHLTTDDYRGSPPQIDQLAALVASGQEVDLVMLTIGGNDVGFGLVLSDCYVKECSNGRLDNMQRLLDKVERQLLREVIPAIREAAPSARVVLVGYPYLVPQSEDWVVNCAWLTQPEIIAIRGAQREMTSRYDQVAATASNARVPTISISGLDALATHELCTTDSYYNPVLGKVKFAPEQGHPTVDGYSQWALQIQRQLRAERVILH